jgi:hypothetical protein
MQSYERMQIEYLNKSVFDLGQMRFFVCWEGTFPKLLKFRKRWKFYSFQNQYNTIF